MFEAFVVLVMLALAYRASQDNEVVETAVAEQAIAHSDHRVESDEDVAAYFANLEAVWAENAMIAAEQDDIDGGVDNGVAGCACRAMPAGRICTPCAEEGVLPF